jgi:plastocyanin
MTRTTRTAVRALVLGALLASCGGDDGPGDDAATTTTTEEAGAEAPADDATVVIDTFIYRPDPLTVPAGATVRWVQQDGTVHTVTSGTREEGPDGTFDAELAQGEELRHTFEEAGTYDYYCTIHSGPGMTGQIVVE